MVPCESCNEKTDAGINCDTCKKVFCSDCSRLTASELKCIALKKRRLIFLCEECEQGFKLVPVLLKKVETLEKKIQELCSVRQTQASTEPQNVVSQFENCISEMEQRKNRSKNIIIMNVKESSKPDRNERIAEETQTIKKLLENIKLSDNNFKLFRLGKYTQERNRPLKVCFNSSADAVEVLRNRTKINIPNLLIFGDQTVQQRDYYKFIKARLNALIAGGDNTKTIKYINSVPTIVPLNRYAKN